MSADATISFNATAGAGGAVEAATATSQLKLSPALDAYVKEHGPLLEPIKAPKELLATDQPLANYFISSTHNTYATGHQLYGSSDAEQYAAVIRRGARCVECDVWPDGDVEDGLKVVHGFTLVSNISFRSACVAIKSAMPPGQLPVVMSLECHVKGIEAQKRIVSVLREVFGDTLLDARIDGVEMITLEQARGKLLVKVEADALPGAPDAADDDESSDDEADELKAQKRENEPARISDELGAVGAYTRSLKPKGDDWLDGLEHRAKHLVANISESALLKALPRRRDDIARHNSTHLARVYPKGTRISSANLKPAQFWAVGASIVALNWQVLDSGLLLNEALFAGTDGWLLKPTPAEMRSRGKRTLTVRVVGACNLVPPADASKGLEPYVTVKLEQRARSDSQRTKTVKRVKDDPQHGAAPVWDETLTFEYEDEPLAFLRFKLVHDDRSLTSRDDLFALAAVRLDWAADGLHALPLLDLSGSAMPDARLVVHFSRQ